MQTGTSSLESFSLSAYPSWTLLFPKFLSLQGKFETGTSGSCVL